MSLFQCMYVCVSVFGISLPPSLSLSLSPLMAQIFQLMQFSRAASTALYYFVHVYMHASFKCAQIKRVKKELYLSIMQCRWFEIMVRYVCYRSRFLLTVQKNVNYKNSFINRHHTVKMRTAINCTLRSLYSQQFCRKEKKLKQIIIDNNTK